MKKLLSDRAALKILKSDRVYEKTSVNFEYALINAVESLEEKIEREEQNEADELKDVIDRLDRLGGAR